LQVRNYRLFWFSQLISVMGSWMQTTAQAWLVLQLTNSAFALGLVTMLQFLPITLFSLYGGVIADRLPKRPTLVVTQTLLLIQALVFGVLVATGAIQLWHIYLLAITQGLVTAVDNPVRQAFVIELVPKEQLVNAVALNSMMFNGARIIGPGLAGFIMAQIGIAPTLFFNAVTFIAVIGALFLMNEAAMFMVPPAKKANPTRQLIEGLAYTWRTPQVLLIMIVVGAIGTFGYNFSIVLPLLAKFVLHTDDVGYGALSSFFGLGSFIAALGVAYAQRVSVKRLLIGSAAFSIFLGAVAVSQVFNLSVVLLVALGFAGIIFATTANTLLQLTVPPELRGRVMSLYVLLFMGSTPIGAFLIGGLSNTIGVSATLFACALLCMVGVIFAYYYHRTHVHITQTETVQAETVKV
jgi:MFS family permease